MSCAFNSRTALSRLRKRYRDKLTDEIAQTVVSDAGGAVFKHTGDGVCAVFWSAQDAVAAAEATAAAAAAESGATADEAADEAATAAESDASAGADDAAEAVAGADAPRSAA